MERLIYYPNFEPQNLNWLKYALIYVEQFSPIIPNRGESSLSKNFSTIRDNTDLIKVLEPKDHGIAAAIKATQQIEYIENHPEQFRDLLQSANIIRDWGNPQNWTYELYYEKLTGTFIDDCINKGYGARSTNGILVSKGFAQLYMTILANEIAFEKSGNPITDSNEYDQFSSYLRARSKKKENLLTVAQTVIQKSLPQDISRTDLSKFIEFRQDSGITELRQSFNQSLDGFYESLEEDRPASDFIASLESTNKELVKEIGLFFGGIISTTLGGVILLENPNNLEATKQVVEGTILTIGGVTAIHKAWKDGSHKRHARKFLSRVSNI